jgi:hypothetical protein
MKKDDAKAAILREWEALPEVERMNDAQIVVFAMKMSRKYPFRCSGDRYQHIMGWLQRRFA